uniref:hypothetical protein n=1 Tax=Candidatus Electronema sp. TaxID=2698783 RepID=UPI0040570FE0
MCAGPAGERAGQSQSVFPADVRKPYFNRPRNEAESSFFWVNCPDGRADDKLLPDQAQLFSVSGHNIAM